MSTPISRVQEILDVLISQDTVFTSSDIPLSFCKAGVIQASIALKKDFPMRITTDEQSNEIIEIDAEISDKEIYLASLYAYRNYAVKEHDTMRMKAINFKTISFAVTGLTERAKATMRIVWWCDQELERVLADLQPTVGIATRMVGD